MTGSVTTGGAGNPGMRPLQGAVSFTSRPEKVAG